MQVVDQRGGEATPGLQAGVRGEAEEAALEVEERVDAPDRLQRDRGDLVRRPALADGDWVRRGRRT